MSWRHFFGIETANTVSVWDHTFELTPDHLSREETEPLKYSYDILADQALERLNTISPPANASLPRNSTHPSQEKLKTPAPKRDLYELLLQNHASDPVLSRLWEEANTVPPWVDWAQIARGQDVFYRYSGASVNGLAFQSLVGGMGAARVVEVLARTGGFSTRVARHRLYETTQFVLQCTRSADAVRPGGDGWVAGIRVRLLHAAVRQRMLRLEAARPGYYSVERYGVPVNDLDCIGTIASFSSSLIWLSFPRQGIRLRRAEIVDYLALWRYIGYLVGAPTDYFATPKRAKAVMESLLLYEVDPSVMSGTLSRNVIEALSSIPPTYASQEFLSATCRWLLGRELCDRLGIIRPPLYYYVLVMGQCLFFMGINYTYRSVESWDRYKIDLMKRGMWKWIVESPHGLKGEVSQYDFKYVPEEGKSTVYESAERMGLIPQGVERRNLITFAIFGGALAVSSLIGFKFVGFIVRTVSAYR